MLEICCLITFFKYKEDFEELGQQDLVEPTHAAQFTLKTCISGGCRLALYCILIPNVTKVGEDKGICSGISIPVILTHCLNQYPGALCSAR